MKLYCQYSGVSFTLPHLAAMHDSVVTVHPIFHCSMKQLSKLYSSWQDGALDPIDRRLLFLATLRASNLVDWETTAHPTDATVQLHMSSLWDTIQWITAIISPAYKLPNFVVTNDTATLNNIGHWIEVWEDARANFESGYRTMSEINKQLQREETLQRLIKSHNEDAGRYIGLLAQWAMEATNVPLAIRDDWRALLCTKGVAVFGIRKCDIDEIVEHFEDGLASHGSIYSYAILKYVRKMQQQVAFGLGYNADSVDLVDVITESRFSIVEDADVTDTEKINMQKLINSAPATEPLESNYPNKVAYLRAKIAWQMSQRATTAAANRQQQLAAELETKLAEDAATNEEEI